MILTECGTGLKGSEAIEGDCTATACALLRDAWQRFCSKRHRKNPTIYARTYVGGGEQRQTMYVRSLEMSPRSAGWEGEQRETTAAMYARTYVCKDVPTYVRTYLRKCLRTYVRRPNGRRRTPPKTIRTYVRMNMHTNVHTYVKSTAPLRFGSPSPACL